MHQTEDQYARDERRARRAAHRHGLTLVKSRRRDPCAIDYCTYHLADERNLIVAGERMTLDDALEYLAA